MKKILIVMLLFLQLWTCNVFAIDKKNIVGLDVNISKFDNLQEENSISINQLLSDIKDNEKFMEYLESKVENVYDVLADFIINNPTISKEFEDENGNISREYIRSFFKLFLSTEDIMDYLVMAIVDTGIEEINVGGDVREFMNKVYIEVDEILDRENLYNILNIIYSELVGSISENEKEYSQDVIYNEVSDIVHDNNLEGLFDDVYDKVIQNISNDDILL